MHTTQIIENCEFEWHKERGVLYVHDRATGATVLRVCQLPTCTRDISPGDAIDITLAKGSRVSLPLGGINTTNKSHAVISERLKEAFGVKARKKP